MGQISRVPISFLFLGLGEEGFEEAERFFVGGFFFDGLSKEAIDFVNVFKGEVCVFIRSGFIFPDPDQQFVFLIIGQNFSHFANQLKLVAVDNVG